MKQTHPCPLPSRKSLIKVAVTTTLPTERGDTPEGGTPHMKGVGMRVVSLRGVNLGLCSHLWCSGQNANIFSREGLV